MTKNEGERFHVCVCVCALLLDNACTCTCIAILYMYVHVNCMYLYLIFWCCGVGGPLESEWMLRRGGVGIGREGSCDGHGGGRLVAPCFLSCSEMRW